MRIVPPLDVLKQVQPGGRVGAVGAPIKPLTFQRREAALGHRIVVGIAHGAPRRADAHLLTAGPDGQGGVLTAMIRMVDHVGRSPLRDRHIQRTQHQIGLAKRRHRPPDHPPTPRVHHDGQGQEARPRRHVRDVGHPQLIRRTRRELALHQIGGHMLIGTPARVRTPRRRPTPTRPPSFITRATRFWPTRMAIACRSPSRRGAP